ncbi:hypothetical protein J6590_096751, partial [Homalodisca vitripennis]
MTQFTKLEALRIFCLNIRSLRKHYDGLIVYLASLSEKFNVIILTEVWIREERITGTKWTAKTCFSRTGQIIRPAESLSTLTHLLSILTALSYCRLLSLSTWVADFKVAVVVPVYKSGYDKE